MTTEHWQNFLNKNWASKYQDRPEDGAIPYTAYGNRKREGKFLLLLLPALKESHIVDGRARKHFCLYFCWLNFFSARFRFFVPLNVSSFVFLSFVSILLWKVQIICACKSLPFTHGLVNDIFIKNYFLTLTKLIQ